MSSREVLVPAAAVLKNGVEQNNKLAYPTPLASHENVIKDPSLFWDTLRNFHSLTGTKHMIPVIGGKELNLHVLYGEVTKRGGYDKVVAEKKWREVSSVFMFSPTTTSASYALRKHYFNFLYHYEQLYFFKLQAPASHSPTTEPWHFEAIGTIDGKFDCGYLVSVKLGSQILTGVLYHPEDQHEPNSKSKTTQSCTAIIPFNPTTILQQPSLDQKNKRPRRRRRRRGGDYDPSRPKPNRSGYNFFFAEKHAKLKSLHPEREREFTKMIGESWNNLSKEERMVYQEHGLKDKERYQREMKEYKETLIHRQC